jgi:hypothetical protein
MTEQEAEEFEELSGLLMAQTSLMTTLLGVMQNKGLLNQATVNEIIDLALVGVEASEHCRPSAFRYARRSLENFSRTMGGRRRLIR